jgi:hypothetical protein
VESLTRLFYNTPMLEPGRKRYSRSILVLCSVVEPGLLDEGDIPKRCLGKCFSYTICFSWGSKRCSSSSWLTEFLLNDKICFKDLVTYLTKLKSKINS